MNDNKIKTLGQVRQFLQGTADIELEIETKAKRYVWIEDPDSISIFEAKQI